MAPDVKMSTFLTIFRCPLKNFGRKNSKFFMAPEDEILYDFSMDFWGENIKNSNFFNGSRVEIFDNFWMNCRNNDDGAKPFVGAFRQ